jgi:hypothetical protein
MTRSDESRAIAMLRGAQTMNKVAKEISKENNAPQRRVYAKPVRGAIPTLCGNDLDGFVTTGDPFDGEQPVLIIPLTDECVAHLYDRVVTALSGVPRKLDLASEVLAVIGIEKEPRTPARLFQEDEKVPA